MAKYRIGNNNNAVKIYNTYEDYTDPFIEGSLSNNSNSSNDISIDEIQKWLLNPEDNYEKITNYMIYMYLSDGSIYQLYTLFKVLPKLNYKIKTFDTKIKGYAENLLLCEKALYKAKYKQLSRDIIGQMCVTGTLICMWLGDKKTPYLYIFDNNSYVFAPYRRDGEWVAVIDLAWIEDMEDLEKERMYETFKAISLKSAYEKYQKDSNDENKYLELPQDKTCVLKINTIFRNQRIGVPMGTQSLLDIKHKKELRTLETNIINKIIKGIAILTIGDKEHEYEKIGQSMKKKIISSVQASIKKSSSATGIPVSILPNYASLNFPNVEGVDIFKDGDDKFVEVNNSIQSAQGVNGTLTGSNNGSNYQSAKLSLDILYARIDVILEEIQQVFQKLFYIILNKSAADNYVFEFITGTPLTNKEEIDILSKLHAEGMSYKSIIDMLSSVSYSELLNDSIKEIKDMGLRDVITPPKTSSTLSADDNSGGRPVNKNPDNESTVKSQETGGNLIDGSTK